MKRDSRVAQASADASLQYHVGVRRDITGKGISTFQTCHT